MSASTATSAAPTTFQKMDGWFNTLSDFINPILVKEARQAMKSRSFVLTFAAVLMFAWLWSVFGVSLMSPGIRYVPGGRYMFTGYYLVLAVPLMIVAPFAAFRSMSAERGDGTFELLSITNLKPWQVVLGKLGGSTLQILLYLSALSPCLAITYLLRGMDIFMILFVILGVSLASLMLCAFGVYCGALVRPDRWQNAGSVALLLFLLVVGGMSTFGVMAMITSGVTVPVLEANFWTGVLAVLTLWVCFYLLLVFAAAAEVTFAADNRSTALRVTMLITHVVWFGWATWIWRTARFDAEALLSYLMPMSLFWAVAGAYLMGEPSKLTPRVLRQLPASFFGRMFGTLFYPGRGLGYLFVVANVLVLSGAVIYLSLSSPDPDNREEVLMAAMMLPAFIVAYLGFANILLRVLDNYGVTGTSRSVFVVLILVVFGSLIPTSIKVSNPRIFGREYSDIQSTDVVATMRETFSGGFNEFLEPDSWVKNLEIIDVPIMVLLTAFLTLLTNLLIAAPELMIARLKIPQRVAEELVEDNVVEHQPSSPWDD